MDGAMTALSEGGARTPGVTTILLLPEEMVKVVSLTAMMFQGQGLVPAKTKLPMGHIKKPVQRKYATPLGSMVVVGAEVMVVVIVVLVVVKGSWAGWVFGCAAGRKDERQTVC